MWAWGSHTDAQIKARPPCFAGWWALLQGVIGIGVWFFPGMLPVQHALFQSRASHLLPADPCLTPGPVSQQTALSPQRDPGQPPGSSLPPCLPP